MEKVFVTNSTEESGETACETARSILEGKILKNGQEGAAVLALYGDLGSGKTTFAQALARALGVKEKTKSPTFIIFRKSKISPIAAGQESKFKFFYHFDVYRIHGEKEILDLGWQEIVRNSENIVLVEWADKIEKLLPENCIKITFKHLKGNKREIRML